MYYMKYGKQVPYEANYGGVEYEVPEDEFEEVIKTYLPFSNTEIEKGTFYNFNNKTFRYRPRGCPHWFPSGRSGFRACAKGRW